MAQKRNDAPEPQTDETMAEVEKIIDADAETLRPAQRAVLEMLSGLEAIATEDTENVGFTGDDIARILLAETDEEMWDADELPRFNAKILSGCELAIYGWQVKFSDDPEIVTGLIGPNSRRKMFLLVKSARLNNAGNVALYKLPEVGEEFTWNTSARFIVSKLYWMQKRGWFDNGTGVHARIQGVDLGQGKSVEKLKPLTAMAVAPTEPPF